MHYLAAKAIARHFCSGEECHLFYNRDFLEEVVKPEGWTTVTYLPWPRFYPKEGPFGRIRRTRANCDVVAEKCAGATVIRLHVPVIDTEAINYHINFLRGKYPFAVFSVRVLPDGLLNVRRWPLSRMKEVGQYLKKMRRLIYPSLNYFVFRGDRVGTDSEVVDRIYILPKFPHEYDPAKVVQITSLVDPIQKDRSMPPGGRALVIGQPLSAIGRMSRNVMEDVTEGIRRMLSEEGIHEVVYRGHPRDPNNELYHGSYHKDETSVPLEISLMDNSYDLVVGICSTGLLTARSLVGENCRVVAYGINAMTFKDQIQRESILSVFRKSGVEMVDHR